MRGVPAAVRPNRALVFPFLVAVFPMLWFVARETPVRVVDGQRVATPLSRTLALAVAAIVVSYGIASLVVAALEPRAEAAPAWQRVLFRPTDGTLGTLVVLAAAFAAFVALDATVTLPYWAELVVGVPLLWPLLVAILLTFAVGNAVPAMQAFAVQAAFTAVGLAASAAWTFLLSTGIAGVVFPGE